MKTLDKNLYDFLAEFDDIPTTPGEMAWVPCDCTQRCKTCGHCEICRGFGRKLTTVKAADGARKVVA